MAAAATMRAGNRSKSSSATEADFAALSQAVQWHQAGDLARAATAYEQLKAQPVLAADCLHLLGVIAAQRGLYADSEAHIRLAVQLAPHRADFFENLALALEKQGKQNDAVNAQLDRAALLQNGGKPGAAIAIYQKLIDIVPQRLDVATDLGAAYHAVGEYSKSLWVLTQTLARCCQRLPDGRALALEVARLSENSVDVPETSDNSVERSTVLPELLVNLGHTLFKVGHSKLSENVLQLFFANSSDLSANQNTVALAHWNQGLLHLYRGDLIAGWQEYEWRWEWSGFDGPRRVYGQPVWSGEDLSGKTLLVIAEQGFGDTLQFAPLIREVAKSAQRVIFEVQRELLSLIKRNFEQDNIHIVPRSDEPAQVHGNPHFDYFVALMSLPQRLALDKPMLPLYSKPLAPNPVIARRSARKFSSAKGLKIGLAWAGRPTHGRDKERSIDFSLLAALFAIDGTAWFSLQLGTAAAAARGNSRITDLASGIKNFDDTAALISHLDLIITVDTALAHLAGSMGVEAWVMLSFVPDWRWFESGEHTPWYPSLRLYRQPALGDWHSVIDEVAQALRLKRRI